jgi:hypothetical protein
MKTLSIFGIHGYWGRESLCNLGVPVAVMEGKIFDLKSGKSYPMAYWEQEVREARVSLLPEVVDLDFREPLCGDDSPYVVLIHTHEDDHDRGDATPYASKLVEIAGRDLLVDQRTWKVGKSQTLHMLVFRTRQDSRSFSRDFADHLVEHLKQVPDNLQDAYWNTLRIAFTLEPDHEALRGVWTKLFEMRCGTPEHVSP